MRWSLKLLLGAVVVAGILAAQYSAVTTAYSTPLVVGTTPGGERCWQITCGAPPRTTIWGLPLHVIAVADVATFAAACIIRRQLTRNELSRRTMFAVVITSAIAFGWITYSLNWIMKRHEAIEAGVALWDDTLTVPPSAPAGLWLFGEKGVYGMEEIVEPEHADTARKRLCGLFPEANVKVVAFDSSQFTPPAAD